MTFVEKINTNEIKTELTRIMDEHAEETRDAQGPHRVFTHLAPKEIKELQSWFSPVGIEKAKEMIIDFYSYFSEDIDTETVDAFAESIKDAGIFAIQRGLEDAGKQHGKSTPEDAINIIDLRQRFLAKMTRECIIVSQDGKTHSLNPQCEGCEHNGKNHPICLLHYVDKGCMTGTIQPQP